MRHHPKKMLKNTVKIFASTIIFLTSIPAVSAIPYRNYFEQIDLVNQNTKELNLSLFAKIQFMVDATRFNVAEYIPYQNLPQNDNGHVIANRIFKQTMSTLLNSEFAKDSAIVRIVEPLNDPLSGSIDKNGHSLSFLMKTLETKAQLVYKGRANAYLTYDVSDNEVSLVVSKNIGTHVLAYTHTDNANGVTDQIGVRWEF
ncbi:MAG: hypothetical protein A2Z20_12750 [Bdellovibrionales bacterium RBG_16_40_8]|nr:MAG: hypothetical protein A2Z20_12750 [Bdellovibrionales bacterium RBG_16_40_8]